MGKKRTFEVAMPPPQCKVKKVAVEIPRVFQLCTPTVFIVSEYFVFSEYDYTLPSPTEADKQRICWSVWDADGRDLLEEYQSVIKQNGEKLEIECVPFDWHNRIIKIGAQFDSPPENEMFSGKPESAEVYDWIATIKKAEAAYPHLDGVQMTNAMRRLASYDDEGFRLTYGETPPGETLTPKDLLIQKDIDKLTKWTKHSVVGGIETGIVKDADGNDLAAGHVLTGISAGVYRDKDIDMAGKYAQKKLGVPPASVVHAIDNLMDNLRMDNLYATTIAGDLGQVAFFVSIGRQKKPYIGNHGDATEAELVGDIDGWLIGNMEPRGGSGRNLSEILLNFYCSCNKKDINFSNRFIQFKRSAMNNLEDTILTRFPPNLTPNLKMVIVKGLLGGLYPLRQIDDLIKLSLTAVYEERPINALEDQTYRFAMNYGCLDYYKSITKIADHIKKNKNIKSIIQSDEALKKLIDDILDIIRNNKSIRLEF